MAAQKQKYIALAIVLSSIASTAFFLAQGTTNLLAATFLGVDPAVGSGGGTPIANAGPSRARRRDDTQILRRNIFDSEQGPLDGELVDDTPQVETEEPVEDWDPTQPPPACDGSMRLVAAVVNPRRSEWSFAAIIGAAGKAMLYRAGQEVDGRTIVAVLPNRVYMRPTTGRVCQIAMFADEEGAPVASRPTRVSTMAAETPQRPTRPTREGAISSADLESGITRNSDTNFTIQRGLVDQILENQAELMRTARIIPHEENGRVVGVKMYGIRRNSLLGRLGVQNGDMLRTINGYDMSSPDSALEAYARLRSADHLTLSIVRRGSPATIDYNIQ